MSRSGRLAAGAVGCARWHAGVVDESGGVRVVTRFVRSKYGQDELCEDVVAATESFTAVFDGSTDVSGLRIDGVTGGRLAALTAAEALDDLAPDADVHRAVGHLSDRVADRNFLDEARPLQVGRGRPSTAMLIFSHHRRELCRIGDSGFAIDDQIDLPDMPIDQLAYGLRAAYLHALIAGGADPAELTESDPGHELLKPLYVAQRNLTNQTVPYGYGALDGSTVHKRFIECIPVPADARRLVLVTDGYPFIHDTLRATEDALAELTASDPLGITDWPRPLGVGPLIDAFDDRAWIELDLG